MKQSIKLFCLLAFMQLMVANAYGQQLSNIYLTQKGKAAYRIAINNIYVVLSENGKLTEIKTDAYGTIIYNINKRVDQIGDVKIGFNYQGFVNNIGATPIIYDYNGRIDMIGNLELKYNYNGLLVSIGGQSIIYNLDNTIDRFDRFKINYNYEKQVQQIDNSNGLIILQLNYDK